MNNKQRAFVEFYLQNWNARKAAESAGYAHPQSQGPRLLLNVEVQAEIKRRLEEMKAGADEVLIELTDQMRADLGQFFKVVERWTFNPQPTHEIIEEEEVPDKYGGVKTRYKIRTIAVDVDRLTDPEYSHLLKKFTDNANGLTVEIHDKQGAAKLLGMAHRLFVERQEIEAKLSIPELDKMLDKVYGSNDNQD